MLGSQQLEQHKILVFELNWMGDILFSIPFLRALRSRFPESYISCVVVTRYSHILLQNKWINEVHVMTDRRGIKSFPEKMKFTRMLMRENYDMAFFLKTSRTKAFMAKIAGISRRVGFSGKKASLTDIVEKKEKTLHRSDHISSLISPFGVRVIDGTYECEVSQEQSEHAQKILRSVKGGTRNMVVLNPGGNWDAKRWPKENFIELGQRLLAEFSFLEIAVTGSEKDVSLAEEIVKELDEDRSYSLAGKTGLSDLAAVFAKSSLVISADSGPLHLASSVGTPTVGIFGPTSPDITGPRGKGTDIIVSSRREISCKVPCYELQCSKNHECMRKITPDKVLAASRKEISKIPDDDL